MEWNSMGKFIKSLREGVEPQAEATMMKDTGEIVHNCAKHVEHAEWGKGATLAEEHAAPDESGNIAWYDIMFEHGLERQVPTDTLNILVSEAHAHCAKKKTVKEAANAPVDVDKNQAQKKAAFAAADKATAATGTNTGEPVIKQGSSSNEKSAELKMTKEAVEELDELSKKTLGSYVKKATLDEPKVEKQATDAFNSGDMRTGAKLAYRAMNRYSGVRKATDKLAKEDLDFVEEVDETIEYKTQEITVNEADKNYDGYFKAAMKSKGIKHPGELKSDEEKKKFFNKVDAGFKAKNEDVFVEAWMRSDVAERIAAHTKAGNKVSDEQHTTKNGEGHHSFVVTEPSGKRTRHIFHGNTRKLETMSAAPKSKLAHETGEDEDDK